MTSFLCITLRFLDPVPRFHGRGDDGNPEWPPSPLRFFQALVCASAARWRDKSFDEYARPALHWLEAIRPTILSPQVPAESFGYRMYVPNNSGDLMTVAWARGDTETSMAKFRVEKDIRPTHLLGGDGIHFLFPLGVGVCPHFDVLAAAARSITHLGWGVDMVTGNATVITEDEAAKLPGERWLPADGPTANNLRVPRVGTLNDLVRKHGEFLNRLSEDGFKPVGPLREFQVVGYRRATEPESRRWVAFAILKPDASGNASFDAARRCRDVAAWVRHATGQVCQHWPFPDYEAFVHGHDANGNQIKGERADERFMYLPLPTINHALKRVESIRRVLIAAPPGFNDRITWIRRRLPGQELVWDQEAVGLLNLLVTDDWVLNQYLGPKDGVRSWSTVTPVVWPGHDDRDPDKAERILRKAFVDAGISRELVDGITELEWRGVGFRAGVDLATRYCIPQPLKGPRYHVRVKFSHPIRGPFAVGAGRYRGLGLFAAESV